MMNQQLIRSASTISPQAAERKLTVGGGQPITVDFLVIGGKLMEEKKSLDQLAAKKPYEKPTLWYERVFETQALSCLKANNGVPHCKGGNKTS